jgi:hypothetical protein
MLDYEICILNQRSNRSLIFPCRIRRTRLLRMLLAVLLRVAVWMCGRTWNVYLAWSQFPLRAVATKTSPRMFGGRVALVLRRRPLPYGFEMSP